MPVGCFGILTLFVVFVGSIALIVFQRDEIALTFTKSALARAKAHLCRDRNSRLADQRGISRLWETQTLTAHPDEANLSIPISGPKGKGTIYVAANKSLGRWNYSGLIVEIAKTHQRIDLLQSGVSANSP